MRNILVNLHLKVDNVRELKAALDALEHDDVLVGFPSDAPDAERNDGPNNATIAYVHDQGSPARGIPQREFMGPGVEAVAERITDLARQTGQKALDGDTSAVQRGLTAIGLTAENGIKAKITEGPFTPLSETTLRARRARGRSGTKPLNDTGQMRNAVRSVTRRREPK